MILNPSTRPCRRGPSPFALELMKNDKWNSTKNQKKREKSCERTLRCDSRWLVCALRARLENPRNELWMGQESISEIWWGLKVEREGEGKDEKNPKVLLGSVVGNQIITVRHIVIFFSLSFAIDVRVALDWALKVFTTQFPIQFNPSTVASTPERVDDDIGRVWGGTRGSEEETSTFSFFFLKHTKGKERRRAERRIVEK